MALPANKTRIVATIGPASSAPEVLVRLVWAGLDVARLNFSHGDFDDHARVIEDVRAAARAAGRRVAIMADLPGPKLRIGRLARDPMELAAGDTFTLTVTPDVSEARRVSVSFPRLAEAARPGSDLYLNDALIQLEVTRVDGADVVCRVVTGGELRSRKGLSLPGLDLGMAAFTPRDRECLAFALAHGVDAVSQSFVESAADVRAVREAAAADGHQPFVIAKIERARACDRIGEILDAADGIMVARGDLGVEIPIERIALVQKALVREANLRGKPVIIATEMLESMTAARRPTRAEATDVANAVLDGTDAVMLSGESAMGRYPVDAVAMLARIAAAVEPLRPAAWVRESLRRPPRDGTASVTDVISLGIEAAVEQIAPAAVVVPTRGGATARRITRFRLPVWIVAVCGQESICQHLQFSYGVHPIFEPDPPDDWRSFARQWLRTHGLSGRHVLLAAGPSPRHPDANHRVEVIDLES